MNGAPPDKRLLFISRNFPPLTGGMERLNYHAYLALRSYYRLSVCGPTGSADYVRFGDFCREVSLTPLLRFLGVCQWQAWRMARQTRPTIVYSGSGLTAPAALAAGRSVGARVVSYLHGLDVIANHPIYRAVFLPAIRRCDRLLVNSRYTAELALRAGVPDTRISVVHPGVNLPDLSKRIPHRIRFRERYALGDRPVLLSAGRITERKGLVQFIYNVLPVILRSCPDAVLVVVGDEPDQALKHRSGVVERIKMAAKAAAVDQNIVLTGGLDDTSLSDSYFAADLMVFPVVELPGDVEGFGMVAIEAAAHGLPTAAFAVGGVEDAVVAGLSGWLIPPGDHQGMIDAVLNALGTTVETRRQRIESSHKVAAENYSEKVFRNRLLSEIDFALQ